MDILTRPITERIMIYAQHMGSSSTTARGATRYLAARPQRARFAVRHMLQRATRTPPLYARSDRARLWHTARQERTADPEAKRARSDKKFRRKWLRRLRAESKQLLHPPMRTGAELREAISVISDHNDRLSEIARLCEIAGARPPRQWQIPNDLPTDRAALIPISVDEARRALGPGEIRMAGKNAALYAHWSTCITHETGHTEWRNGRPTEYTRAENDHAIQSWAYIADDQRTVDVAVGYSATYSVTLPAPYHWEIDTHGAIRAIRDGSRGDDYHPDATDLRRGAEHIVEKIERNAAKRRRTIAEFRADGVDLHSVYVCRQDSYRAGNCRTETETWIQRHGITNGHIRADRALSFGATDQLDRVTAAVYAAAQRHKQEMAQGFALLSNHK